MSAQNCIFCKIIEGTIPSEIVYSDEHTLAFRDLNPQAPVHVLVIPRTHVESLNDASSIDDATLGRVLHSAALVAQKEGLSETGFRTVINTGAGAGQSVFHLHAHVIGGRALSWPPG